MTDTVDGVFGRENHFLAERDMAKVSTQINSIFVTWKCRHECLSHSTAHVRMCV